MYKVEYHNDVTYNGEDEAFREWWNVMHNGKYVCEVSSEEDANSMIAKLNSHAALVSALEDLAAAARRIEGFAEACTAAVHKAEVTLLIAKES